MVRTSERAGREGLSLSRLVCGCCLFALMAGCSSGSGADEVAVSAPAEWWGSDGSDDRAGWVKVRLEPDGVAELQNVPVWDGVGNCSTAKLPNFSGSASWHREGSIEIDVPDSGSVLLLPTSRFGKAIWTEIDVALCGPDSPQSRILFLSGGGSDGELTDPRDIPAPAES